MLRLAGTARSIRFGGGSFNSGNAVLTRLPELRAIPPGGSTTFDVTVTYPTTGLTGTATVSIANNDANENPYNFTISAESS